MGTSDLHEILQGEQVTPTMNLRWWGTKYYKRPVLQQEFIVQFFKDGVLIENKTEWRDVQYAFEDAGRLIL